MRPEGFTNHIKMSLFRSPHDVAFLRGGISNFKIIIILYKAVPLQQTYKQMSCFKVA